MEKERKNKIIERVVKGVLFGIAALLLGLGLLLTFIQQPIPGSIYKTNTTFEEREELWYAESKRIRAELDSILPLSYFERYMEPRSGSIGEVLYKYSIDNSSNTLSFTLYNNSVNTVKVYSIYFKNKENSLNEYSVLNIDRDFISKDSSTYSIEVDEDFVIDNYIIYCSYRNNGHLWSQHPISSYQKELERTKYFTISDMIDEEIGERPDKQKEGAEEGDGRPEYMRYIIDARLSYCLCYMGAVLMFIIATVVTFNWHIDTKPVIAESFDYDYDNSLPVDEIINEIPVSECECRHHHPVKKVVCLYCGSRYRDDLDECPDCGSSRIKEENSNE